MARKSPASRRRAEKNSFDDDAYENVRFSATFDYNELARDRAAAVLAPRAHRGVLFGEGAALVGIVAVALTLGVEGTTVPLVALFLVALVLIFVANRWPDLQLRHTRGGSLDPAAGGERMHVVVCDDAVHVRSDKRPVQDFDLSRLRVLHDNEDFLVAGFGGRDYVYVPRAGLSENRYRELTHFLRERCDA